MKYGLLLLLATALVAGVWLVAPERDPAAPPAVVALETAVAREETRTVLVGPGLSAERLHLAAPVATAERSEQSPAPAPAGADLEELEREHERVLEELFAGIDSAADERFRRGAFELATEEDPPSDQIQVVRRSPTGAYERVELTLDDHPELYALRERAQSLQDRIEALASPADE